MFIPMETVLGRLGSRFFLNFRPRERQLRASPLGKLCDRPLRLEIALSAEGERYVWPFSPGVPIGACKQEMTMTGLRIGCISDRLGVELLISFVAPFYPRNEKLSVAPFFYLDLTCRPLPDKERVRGEIKVGLFAQDDDVVARSGSGVVLRGSYRIAEEVFGIADEFSKRDFAGTTALIPIRGKMALKDTTFSIPYSVEDGAETKAAFLLAAHCEGPVLDIDGAPHRFRYMRWFPAIAEVAKFAMNDEAGIRRCASFFDDLFLRSSAGLAQRHLTAHSFQSFLSATWWTEPASGEADWFSCWDNQAIHNSLASESAYSLLNLVLWPELLEKQLDQRASARRETGVFPGECGRFLSVRRAGGRAATAEEVCDYILLIFAHWRWWNRFELIETNAPLIKRLGDFLLFSDRAKESPVHDESSHPRLLLKRICALEATAAMADEIGDGDLSASSGGAVRELRAELSERALDKCPSIRITEGLLYSLICDSFPELDYAMIRRLLRACGADGFSAGGGNAEQAAERAGVSSHLRRDIIAAYLGIDFTQMAQRYWSFQSVENAREGGGGYVDSPFARNPAFDPRGAIAIGMLLAPVSLKLDRVERSLVISPLAIPASVPLLPLADWEAGRVPWVKVRCEGSRVVTEIDERELLGGEVDVSVEPHPELTWGGS